MQRNTKEWIQYGSAMAMLASGVAMAFASFFLNGGDLKDSVLWYVSQTLDIRRRHIRAEQVERD